MLKDQTTQPTLFQEDSHANHSQLQENEEDKTMIVTSGMKLLELLPKQNQNGLLAKMLKGLLTSTTAWYSDRCKLIWKKKVSKSNVLLYQLQASVLGIKEKEFGSLPTPTTMDHIDRKGMRPSRAATNRKTGYLSEMIRMFPTPTSGMHKQDVIDQGEYAKRVQEKGHQVTLPAAVKLLPTPTANDYKGWSKGHKRAEDPTNRLDFAVEPDKGVGGTLNPNWVEWLMGFPIGFTDLEDSETQ